jgi:hypothetical protein
MRCLACSDPIKPAKAKRSGDQRPGVENWTLTCKCGHEMSWTGRSRSKPANAVPEQPRVGHHFTARAMTGTVVS